MRLCFFPVSQRLNATPSLCAASVVIALRPRWKRGALAVPAADALCRFLRDHGSVDVRWSAADADGDAVLCTGPAAAATTSGGGHSGHGTRNADDPKHSRASTRLRFTHQAVVELGFPCQTSVAAESASTVGWILSVRWPRGITFLWPRLLSLSQEGAAYTHAAWLSYDEQKPLSAKLLKVRT